METVVSSAYDNVVINGNFSNWNGWGVTLTDALMEMEYMKVL